MISFKGAHFPKDVILYAVFFYVDMVFLIVTLKPLWKKDVLKLMALCEIQWVIEF